MADQSIPLDVTVVTGMSGAGRSAAADVLEDLGFFVIDNLPPALIPKVAELGRAGDHPSRFALVVDVRSGEFMDDLLAAVGELRETGAHIRVLFLDAADLFALRGGKHKRLDDIWVAKCGWPFGLKRKLA